MHKGCRPGVDRVGIVVWPRSLESAPGRSGGTASAVSGRGAGCSPLVDGLTRRGPRGPRAGATLGTPVGRDCSPPRRRWRPMTPRTFAHRRVCAGDQDQWAERWPPGPRGLVQDQHCETHPQRFGGGGQSFGRSDEVPTMKLADEPHEQPDQDDGRGCRHRRSERPRRLASTSGREDGPDGHRGRGDRGDDAVPLR